MSRRLRVKILAARSLLEPRSSIPTMSSVPDNHARNTTTIVAPNPSQLSSGVIRCVTGNADCGKQRLSWVKDLCHVHTQFEMLMVRFAATAGNCARLLLHPCLQEIMTLCLTQAPRPPVLLFILRLLYSMAAKKLNALPLPPITLQHAFLHLADQFGALPNLMSILSDAPCILCCANVYCITCLPTDWLPSTHFLYCCSTHQLPQPCAMCDCFFTSIASRPTPCVWGKPLQCCVYCVYTVLIVFVTLWQ